MQEIKKILIINLAGIGDLLLSTPALRGLRNLYFQAEISMLVIPRALEIVKDLPYIDRVFVFNVGYGGAIPVTKIFGNIRTLLTLRKEHFDLAVNMRTLVSDSSAKKIKFLMNIINPEKTAGRDTDGRGCFFDIRIPETKKGQKYEMEYDIDTVRALGAEVIDKSIDFRIDEEAQAKVKKILEEEGIAEGTVLIGIHPGGMPSHRWPLENFSEVMKSIRDKIPCEFVITGGREDAGLAGKLAGEKAVNLAGRLDIKELGALIKRCDLFISNDTGPMHIAAILKTPLVAIFGPGQLIRFNPKNISDKTAVMHEEITCAPCDRIECGDLSCLKKISPEEVVAAISVLLKK